MLRTAYFGPRSSPLDNQNVCDFVSVLIWGRPGELPNGCSMGVFDGDRLVAGTVYHNWDQAAGVIQLSSASTTRRWLTKPVIRAMLGFAFGPQVAAQLAVLRVSERNTSMVRIARSFGFAEVFVPRLRGRDEGEFIFTFSDDQWRASRFNEAA